MWKPPTWPASGCLRPRVRTAKRWCPSRGLRLPDAILIASAQELQARLLTYDDGLAQIGEHALRGGSSTKTTNGRALVLRDVLANPRSSISTITERTGLPQSYVSESIAALCEDGILRTSVDPQDRRRTLASVSPAHRRRVAARASTQIDGALAQELGEERAALVLPLLRSLAELLAPEQPGQIVAAIRAGDRS